MPVSLPLPMAFAIPVALVVVGATLARCLFLREEALDRLINRSMIWASVSLSLHLRPDLPGTWVSLIHQLLAGAMLAILAGIMGIAALWSGADPDTARRRQRRYDLATAVAFAALLAVGTPARRRGLLIDELPGGQAVLYWSIFAVPLLACSALVPRHVLREYRTSEFGGREKLVYGTVSVVAAGLAIDAVTGPVVAAIDAYTPVTIDSATADTRKAVTYFAVTLILCVAAALPLFGRVLSWAGVDRTGRACRRLRPLWRDLTAAFPGVVLYTEAEFARIDPSWRLQRMVVEISDALLALRVGMPPGRGDGPDRGRARRGALRIATALAAHPSGLPVEPVPSPRGPHSAERAGDRRAELADLLAVAREWPSVAHYFVQDGARADRHAQGRV